MLRSLLLAFFGCLLLVMPSSRAADFLGDARRVVFLGDSITYAGQYVDDFEWHLLTRYPQRQITVINVGLPSETVSGLSEPGHADGKFPRPNLHERLARVLEKTKPDLVFACYGMNDGIYFPFDEGRLAAFRTGMEKLHTAVEAAGAKIIHLTPPVFDVLPLKGKTSPDGLHGPAESYDDVLVKYSEWLLAQQAKGWRVIDVHTALRSDLEGNRRTNPGYTYSKDGVHGDEKEHRVIARALLGGLGETLQPAQTPEDLERLELLRQRGRLLANAWLTECGHQRPGMPGGLPVAEAERKAAEITEKLRRR